MAITTFISGEKWHVTSFNLSDTVIVQARLGNGPNAGAHSLFFCPTDAPGLRVVRSPAYAHTYNHHHPVIAFDRVRVPLADRIGAEGDGMHFTKAWFRRERLMIAARCCGACRTAHRVRVWISPPAGSCRVAPSPTTS